jgi:GNAT superfamily N-acetyltransferase
VPERPTSIALLADHPDLVEQAGILRWTEWGYDDPSPDEWIAITTREAGRDVLPVTLVAIDDGGSVMGVVGLDVADAALTDEERAGRTPWLVGLVVRRDARRRDVGRMLVRAVEDVASERRCTRMWVVTGGDAEGFYRACGWVDVERLVTTKEHLPSTVLTRILPP